MAKFLTTTGVTYEVEKIIKEAKKKLVLISPYVQTSKVLLERLKHTSERGVQVILVYGKNELRLKEKEQLENIPNLKLYYYDNLHAKCYFNETAMVITSMNLYEFSEKTNIEMGVFVSKTEDEEMFNDAIEETDLIVKFAIEHQKSIIGHCIRCSDQINYNPSKPLCKSCYEIWWEWENYEYVENYCHCCGKNSNTTYKLPECYSCYSKN